MDTGDAVVACAVRDGKRVRAASTEPAVPPRRRLLERGDRRLAKDNPAAGSEVGSGGLDCFEVSAEAG
jgi:hypothetical protein